MPSEAGSSQTLAQTRERVMANQTQLYGGSSGFNARSEAFKAAPYFLVAYTATWSNPWAD